MQSVRIWDLPVRLFHWLLAPAFLTAFLIAVVGGDDGPLFPLHALLGLAMVFLVVLRMAWGLIGSRWARFGSLRLRPSSLVTYLREAVGAAPAERHAGHNPATSWFVIATILLVFGLGATGFMMGRGNESVDDLHEVLAWSLVVLAAAHVAGVAWHRVRHRENLAASMITGRKNADASDAIPSARPWSAAAFLLLTAAFAATLAAGYDRATGRLVLPLTPVALQLTDRDDGDAGATSGEEEPEHYDEHDD